MSNTKYYLQYRYEEWSEGIWSDELDWDILTEAQADYEIYKLKEHDHGCEYRLIQVDQEGATTVLE
jgi:hypothetical protein